MRSIGNHRTPSSVAGAPQLATLVSAASLCWLSPLSIRTTLAAQNEETNVSAKSAAAPNANSSQGYDLPQFALAGPKGFGFASQDGSFNLILHWLIQSDFRDFLTEAPTA